VLFVTLDTTRADHLGAYGYPRDTSPVFDALARESIFFERAIAPMATTLPTHVSLFTATHPLEHGVLANSTQGGRRFVPSQTLRSFAGVARDAGYDTAAFVSATPLKRGSGVETGFDHFDQPSGKQRRGDETADAALAWLARPRQRPFALWVHFYDAHWPFEAPEPFGSMFRSDAVLEAWLAERRVSATALRELTGEVDEARAAANGYDGELRFQDAQLGRLLDALRAGGAWERTAVVVLGDHGEGLCQHGEAAHGGTWHEQLHVPLLLRVPGAAARRIARSVSVLDVVPTLLSLIDVPALDALREHASGRDVLAEGAAPEPILSQDTGRARNAPFRYALTDERWKYFRIEAPDGSVSDRLYDLHSDPFELHDRAAAEPQITAGFRALLESMLAARLARGEELRGGEEPRTRAEDPETLEQLRALGYLDAGGGEQTP
jgi:arylsulfatase